MKEIGEQVDRAPRSPSTASPEFDRANQIETGIGGGTDCPVVAGECVMVRYRKSLELQRDGVIDQSSAGV